MFEALGLISLKLQALKPSAVNPGSSWVQRGRGRERERKTLPRVSRGTRLSP
jgi:hypothetical protein